MPSKPLENFYARLFRHPRLVWLAALIVFVLCLVSAGGIVWREDVMDLLPDTDPVVREYREWMDRFRPLDRVYIMIGPAQGAEDVSENELIEAADALYEIFTESPDANPPEPQKDEAPSFNKVRFGAPPSFDGSAADLVRDVIYRMDAGQVLELTDLLKEHRAAYFSEAQEKMIEERLQPEAIRRALEEWKKILTQYPAPMMARQFRHDPLGMDATVLQRLQSFQNLGKDLERHRDRIFSKDRQHILMMVEPVYPSTDSYHAAALVALLDRAKAEVEAKSDGRVHVADLAGHRFGLENSSRVKKDIYKTVTISICGVVLLTFLSFANPLFVLLALLPAAFGASFAMGLIRWLVPEISAISIGSGSMLIGIAVDYGIHILYHADHAPSPERDARGDARNAFVRRILVRLTRPLLLSAATTILAFLTLSFSILPGYRHLGIFAALGISGAAVFALCVMPLLIPRFKQMRLAFRRPILHLGEAYLAATRFIEGHRRMIPVLLIGLTILALAGLPRLQFEGDYQKMNAVSDTTRADWDLILSRFGETLKVSPVIIRGEDFESALQKNEALYARLSELETEGELNSFQSIAPILPSRKTQEANRRRWSDFWSDARVDRLRENFDKIAPERGMRVAAFEGFFDSLGADAGLVTLDKLKKAGLAKLIENHVSIGEDDTMILTHLQVDRLEDFERITSLLKQEFPDLQAANGQAFMQYMVGLIYRELERMGLIASAIIIALLALAFRSLRHLLILLLPLVLAALWTFGYMAWLGIQINLMNSIVTIFILGLVIDYTIFLFCAWVERHRAGEDHLSASGAAVGISAFTTMAGLGALALASHPVLHSIGYTALLGIAFGWLAVFLTFPFLDRYIHDR
ncbi:MAG: MMPL family transporter [Candidatus Sumerlaeia bacterium]